LNPDESSKQPGSFCEPWDAQNANFPGLDLDFQRAWLNQQLEAQEVLLDLTIAPFEPLTPGNGQNIGGEEGEACQRY